MRNRNANSNNNNSTSNENNETPIDKFFTEIFRTLGPWIICIVPKIRYITFRNKKYNMYIYISRTSSSSASSRTPYKIVVVAEDDDLSGISRSAVKKHVLNNLTFRDVISFFIKHQNNEIRNAERAHIHQRLFMRSITPMFKGGDFLLNFDDSDDIRSIELMRKLDRIRVEIEVQHLRTDPVAGLANMLSASNI